MKEVMSDHSHPCCQDSHVCKSEEKLLAEELSLEAQELFYALQKFALENLLPDKRIELAGLLQKYVDARLGIEK